MPYIEIKKSGLYESLKRLMDIIFSIILIILFSPLMLVLAIAIKLDSKFTDINAEMVKLFTDAKHKVIKNAGHNTHLEEPQKFIDEINKFLLVI